MVVCMSKLSSERTMSERVAEGSCSRRFDLDGFNWDGETDGQHASGEVE